MKFIKKLLKYNKDKNENNPSKKEKKSLTMLSQQLKRISPQ
nr:hypothetical protein [Priestia aryabhattai]MDH3132108.1 hypothetical protein [Priestia aryabhattai]